MQPEKTTDTRARNQRRVLLISDDPPAYFHAALEAAKLEIVEVSAAIAASISLRRSRPQVVIAHLPIKGMSARELAQMLSQSPDGVPLILIGEEAATAARRQEAMAAGASDYFKFLLRLNY